MARIGLTLVCEVWIESGIRKEDNDVLDRETLKVKAK